VIIGVMSNGPERPPFLGLDFWRFTSVVRFGKVAERGDVRGEKAGCWES
jgi:hypothetical protein